MDYRREMPLCGVCQQPANQTCGGCKLVYYCSKAHQKLGWREGHKFKCCAFKIQYSDTQGRHMVATRDIKEGEMILKEKPAVYGPRTASTPHCLGCNKKLEASKTLEGKWDFYKCSSCRWPMCGPQCEQAEVHKPECNLMVQRNYKCTIAYEGPDKAEAAYCVIAPIRVLLLKDTNPLQYENILNLESHLEDRINTPLYTVLKANLVTFIIQVLGIAIDEDTILKIASIFDTNAFDVRTADGKRYRAIYVTASMMNHNCKPNTRHVYIGEDIAFIATTSIAKGELIQASYTQTLWGTLDRRRHLRATKCFDCECERCKDPTELGCYLGSIYCSICNGPGSEHSFTRGAMMVSTDPLDEGAIWKCERCDHTILSKQMFWGNNALKQDLAKLDKNDPRKFAEFLDKYKQTLHPRNHLVLQAKLILIQLYGNVKGYNLLDLTDDILKRKIDLCHEMLEVADFLEPGLSKFRGTLLLELQSAMAVQIKRDFESDKITKSDAKDQLTETMVLLEEAANILKVDPTMKDTLEAKIKYLGKQLEDEVVNEDTDIEEKGTDFLDVD